MCKLLIEDTFQSMYNNTLRRFETDRKGSSQRVQVTTTMFIPSIDNNSLEVRAKTRTENANYDSIIYFENVEYTNPENQQAIVFEGADGGEYYILPISRNSQVKVNCTCLDFYYSFAVWNDAKNSLFGDAPDPYIRKTKTREPKNPQKVSGFCKHLLKLFDTLIKDKIIK